MKCINCGADLKIDSNEKFINCEYCGSTIANFALFEKTNIVLEKSGINDLKVNTGVQSIQILALYLKNKNYCQVNSITDKVLEEHPDSWLALAYKAIALFWLGTEDFSHLESVKGILETAVELSNNNELAINIKEQIANDLVTIAVKKDEYGNDLIEAIKALLISKELIPKLNDNAYNLRNKFCYNSFIFLKNYINDKVKRDRKYFDVPVISLDNIYFLGILTRNKEILEYFYLYANWHLNKNQGKSYINKLQDKITATESILKELNSNIIGKRLSFSLFGNLSIS